MKGSLVDSSGASGAAPADIGPRLHRSAPDFAARDQEGLFHRLPNLMGENGLILNFIGNIWQSANVRRIVWLQRHANAFIREGVNVALVANDDTYLLYGFYASSPVQMDFPLLADVDGHIHALYNLLQSPAMLILDRSQVVQHKWIMPDDRVWPTMQEITEAVTAVQRL